MRILLLNPNYINRHNWGHQLFKNELGKHHEVTYYGNGFDGYKKSLTVPQIIKKLNKPFDLILTYEAKYSSFVKDLKLVKDIPKAHIQIDYSKATNKWNGAARKENVERFLKENNYDIFFVTSTSNQSAFKESLNTDMVFVLPFSVDIERYKNKNLKKNYDVMATFTTRPDVYPNRAEIQRVVKQMNIKTFTKRTIHNQYIDAINKSKIFIISNNFNSRLSMKYTEAMACGTFVLADEPEDLELQGFKNGEHLVLYKGIDDLKEKILYYLKNEKERIDIAKNGMSFVRKYHSCSKRCRQFTKIIKRELFK